MSRTTIEMEIADGVRVHVELEAVKGIPARAVQNMAGMLQEALSVVAHNAELEVEALAARVAAPPVAPVVYQEFPAPTSPGVRSAGEELGAYLRGQAELTGTMSAVPPSEPNFSVAFGTEDDWSTEGAPTTVIRHAWHHAQLTGKDVRITVYWPDTEARSPEDYMINSVGTLAHLGTSTRSLGDDRPSDGIGPVPE